MGSGIPRNRLPQQCFQHRFVWGIDTLVELPRLAPKYSSAESELKPPRSSHHLASARPARKASSHSRRNALFVARHHIPQNTLTGETHGGR